jgi:hypothetical protein
MSSISSVWLKSEGVVVGAQIAALSKVPGCELARLYDFGISGVTVPYLSFTSLSSHTHLISLKYFKQFYVLNYD